MNLRIDKILSPFYCHTAIKLCLEARNLCEKGECKNVAEICSFISTLCSENGFETCYRESSICKEVSVYCLTGRTSKECEKAHISCGKAKSICPQNNMVNGA